MTKPARLLGWAKIVRTSFDERRRYEWKVNFAIWSAIALVTACCFKEGLRLFDQVWKGYLMAGAVTLIHVLFTALIRAGHHRDGARLDDLMKKAGVLPEAEKRKGAWYWSRQVAWFIAPTSFTLALAITSVAVIDAAQKAPSTTHTAREAGPAQDARK
jgi:ADP-ribose pyrophosphatase YjhB (NUDIX family)